MRRDLRAEFLRGLGAEAVEALIQRIDETRLVLDLVIEGLEKAKTELKKEVSAHE